MNTHATSSIQIFRKRFNADTHGRKSSVGDTDKRGESKVTKSPEAAEEVVAEAVSRIRKRFPHHKVEYLYRMSCLKYPWTVP
jgi:hypothetical protein